MTWLELLQEIGALDGCAWALQEVEWNAPLEDGEPGLRLVAANGAWWATIPPTDGDTGPHRTGESHYRLYKIGPDWRDDHLRAIHGEKEQEGADRWVRDDQPSMDVAWKIKRLTIAGDVYLLMIVPGATNVGGDLEGAMDELRESLQVVLAPHTQRKIVEGVDVVQEEEAS